MEPVTQRCFEIRSFCEQFPPHTRWIAIDDLNLTMMMGLRNTNEDGINIAVLESTRFVQTNPTVGLTRELAVLAEKKLVEQEEWIQTVDQPDAVPAS